MYVTTSSYMSSYKMAPVAAVLSYSDNRNFRKVSARFSAAFAVVRRQRRHTSSAGAAVPAATTSSHCDVYCSD